MTKLRAPKAAYFAAFATAAALAGAAAPARAFDIGAMSEAERAQFRAEIRAYLLDNPDVLMEAFDVLEKRQAQAQAASDNDLVAAHAKDLFQDGISWVGGNLQGDVTLVEFMDYRCGYCRKAHDEVNELVKSDGNIRYILKEFPILGEESLLAARYAVAVRNVAGPEVYKKVHDQLMALRGTMTEAALDHVVEKAGADLAAVKTEMNSDRVRDELVANRALAQALQVNGTPTFVLGDEILRGYLPLDGMREAVRGEREKG